MKTDLSIREREVLDALVLYGLNKTMAVKLGVSVKTIEEHTRNIFKKTGIRSRVLLGVWWDRQKRAAA